MLNLVKTQLLLVATVFMTPMMIAQGIEFEEGSWDEVLEKAKAEGKPIFVDAYAEWCGPCKWMSREVFTVSAVGDFYNDNYIAYKFDMEKGEGVDFSEEYEVMAYPTLLFFSANGDLTHKAVGALEAEEFLTLSTDLLEPENQVYTQWNVYQEGKKDASFLGKLAQQLFDAGDNEKGFEVGELYLETIPEEQYATEEAFAIISMIGGDPHSEYFDYAVQHRDDFVKAVGEEEWFYYLNGAFMGEVFALIDDMETSTQDLEHMEEHIKEHTGEDADAVAAFATFVYYFMGSKPIDKNYMKSGVNYLENYCKDWSWLNGAAWAVCEQTTKKKYLKTALKWVDMALDIEQNYYNLDTKAHILFKLGKLSDAKAMAKAAIEAGEAEGDDVSPTEDLLFEIEEAEK